MISPFERFVVARYLKGARGRSEGKQFLRFVIYVAIGGVAVGVASLLLALAVVRGFSQEIQDKIMGFGAHVQVERFQQLPIENAGLIQRQLARIGHVAEIRPIVQEFALLRHTDEHIEGVSIWGAAEPPEYLNEYLVEGRFTFALDSAGRSGILLGSEMADMLDVGVGERVTAFSTRDENVVGFRPRARQFYVAGIFETFLSDFDEIYVFTDIGAARDLLAYPSGAVSRFNIQLTDPALAMEVTHQIEQEVGFPYMSRTIFEVYHGLFAWINLQEGIIPIVIGVIIVVAAFNIIGALLMIMLEKARELGVMASMGASPKVLRRLFLWLGAGIGCVGALIGSAMALALALLQQQFAFISLPAQAYFIDAAPVSLRGLDFLIVGGIAVMLCLLAAYIPARAASRMDPVRVIRFR